MEPKVETLFGEDREGERALCRIERKIEKCGSRDLNVLVAAGMDRRVLLRVLALAATGDDTWAVETMRSRQDSLKSMASRLERLARDAKSLVDDPLSKIQVWAYMHGGGRAIGMQWPILWKDVIGVPLIPISMKALGKYMNEEAKAFGKYLRMYERTNRTVVMLLVNCWMACLPKLDAQKLKSGRRKLFSFDYFEELARLLTDASEAAGKDKIFSADGLRQTFKRHGTRMIRLWLKFSGPSPQPEPAHMPAVQRKTPLAGALTISTLHPDRSTP
ncbi:MAG: hypothetical protein WCD43_01410 [Candidatus Acidiferrales bacterium]